MVESGRLKDYDKVIRRAQKKLVESGALGYFDFSYKEGEFKIIRMEEEIRYAEMLCSYYVLETTEVDMEDIEVERHYKGLKQIERCFRDLKELIEVRPIYHLAHIFLCLIAQVILAYVRRRLKARVGGSLKIILLRKSF